jgi:hypothetical protein
MRMSLLGMSPYHWRMQVPHLGDDPASIDAYVKEVGQRPKRPVPPAATFLYAPRAEGPGLAELHVVAGDGGPRVVGRFARALPPGAVVRLLSKPLDGFTEWDLTPAIAAGDGFEAVVPGGGGLMFYAVEVEGGPGVGWRYPDVMTETPYLLLPTP